ncbi:hypothetical protein EDD17DRAFT_1604210 [Pisolithus thermaeus]|nr:hypothetical protein EDD17DRAFT_1604210 [Pisolithus thermaeus]
MVGGGGHMLTIVMVGGGRCSEFYVIFVLSMLSIWNRCLPFAIPLNPSQYLSCLPQGNMQCNLLLNMVLAPYLCLNTYISCCRPKMAGMICRRI